MKSSKETDHRRPKESNYGNEVRGWPMARSEKQAVSQKPGCHEQTNPDQAKKPRNGSIPVCSLALKYYGSLRKMTSWKGTVFHKKLHVKIIEGNAQ
jgi:hypothetical protein